MKPYDHRNELNFDFSLWLTRICFILLENNSIKRDRKSAYKQQQDEPEPVAETSKPKLTVLAPLPQETKRKNTDDSNIDAFFAAKKSKKAPVADTWDDLPQENWSRVIFGHILKIP